MKNILIIPKVTVAVIGLSLFSCSDFLDEELTTKRSLDYYQTVEGLQSLAVGAYQQTLNTLFDGEVAFAYLNYGTDEFKIGGDGSNGVYNNYDGGLKSIVTQVNGNTVAADVLWNKMYVAINTANILIKQTMENEEAGTETKNTLLGEGYFFRGFAYYVLINQYGNVPLKLEPSEVVELEFNRASSEEVTNQVVEDLTKAYDLLPPNRSLKGQLNKSAAAHFLAKAKLYRASEKNDEWNESNKRDDLQSVVSLSDEVIAAHPLAPNFSDLWAFEGPNEANENLQEIILSAQFSDASATARSNRQHLYYLARYDDLPYMQRDISGGRPYSRLFPTYYMFRVYDQINDSRFWKSFKTKHRLNNASGSYYENGDLGIMYAINQPGDDRFESSSIKDEVIYEKTGKTIPSVFVAFPKGMREDGALYSGVRYPSLSKHMDASRPGMNITDGQRDVILARSAETYLLAAEAKVRLANLGAGSYEEALEYINVIRRRAAYKEGENRSDYIDGGASYVTSTSGQDPNINSYYPENSYYESNGIEETTAATDLEIKSINDLPAQDLYIINRLGYADTYDKMLCLILNERSRELAGEYHRWPDLTRTKTLIERAKAFNIDASPTIQGFHALRPIPQTYLDAIQKDGRNLSPDEKQAQQNPGY